MPAHDFISDDWQDCITINHNIHIQKNSESLLTYVKAHSFLDPDHQNRTICKVNDKTAVLLKQGDVYDWHSDSFSFKDKKLENPRPGRYWTTIIYLTKGKPLEIGNWNRDGELGEDFDYPEPNDIISRIYPAPGKVVTFPCFMVHRIQPTVDNDRWTFVDFVTTISYNGFNQSKYIDIANRYFNEDFRSQLLSS